MSYEDGKGKLRTWFETRSQATWYLLQIISIVIAFSMGALGGAFGAYNNVRSDINTLGVEEKVLAARLDLTEKRMEDQKVLEVQIQGALQRVSDLLNDLRVQVGPARR